MATIHTDSFGDEITAADFDNYQPPAYRSALLRHPLCADPDHPGCDKCWCDIEDEIDINDEPIPYDGNAVDDSVADDNLET